MHHVFIQIWKSLYIFIPDFDVFLCRFYWCDCDFILKGSEICKSLIWTFDYCLDLLWKNKTNSCLLLRGYMNLNNTCNEGHAKKLLGKFSNCKPTVFGDVVMLMKLFHVNKQLTVTGRLPAQGNTVEELQGLVQLMRIGLSRLHRNRSTNKTLKVLRLNPNRKRWLPHNIKI